MEKKDYKREYEILLEKYETLKSENQTLNNQLYSIQCSRSYRISRMISHLYMPVRKMKDTFKRYTAKNKKVQKYIDSSKKLVIIPSSFEFDSFVNQRPFNLAKYLSNNGYNVLFVVWQWERNEKINNSYQYVYKNVFQIPLYGFLEGTFDYTKVESKYYFINFPNVRFLEKIDELRSDGFYIYYDIMDEWEEFQKVGQASWYDRNVEEKIILKSDLVSAVSKYLIDKFKHLRGDILLSPNGYFEELTGKQNRNISKKEIENGIVNIGYFGHLTDSWFNWGLIFDLARKHKNYVFHIIGYGAPEKIIEKIGEYDNIKYYGKILMSDLCKYVRDWNIGIIPFIDSNLAKAVDPIKIYEYIYMGLPVIVSGIENVKDYPNVHYISDNATDFSKAVDEILSKKEFNDIEKFLEESTWEARFSQILKEMEKKGMSELYGK